MPSEAYGSLVIYKMNSFTLLWQQQQNHPPTQAPQQMA